MKCSKCKGKGFIEHQGGTIMVKCEVCFEGEVPDDKGIPEVSLGVVERTSIVIAETTPIEEPKPKRKYRKRRVKK